MTFFYKDLIDLLQTLELIIKDEREFKIVRKKVLDIANSLKRASNNGD